MGTVAAGMLCWFDPAYRDLDTYGDLDELYFLVTDGWPSDLCQPKPGAGWGAAHVQADRSQ